MDIKIINSNKEEIYIPMAGLDISEDNGIITVKSGFQHIGEYKTIGPINFKTILDKINEAFIKKQITFDMTSLITLKEEE
jgi:hypothetical protein